MHLLNFPRWAEVLNHSILHICQTTRKLRRTKIHQKAFAKYAETNTTAQTFNNTTN